MGKVHGGLSRAGKVKGQTPKVEPEDKKKKVTGRAARRAQYNARFVNVTNVVGGKTYGPNSNALKVALAEIKAAKEGTATPSA
jgi:small subunit ribosomal protein S30e